MDNRTKTLTSWGLLAAFAIAFWFVRSKHTISDSPPLRADAPTVTRGTITTVAADHIRNEPRQSAPALGKRRMSSPRQSLSSTTHTLADTSTGIDITLAAPDAATFDALIDELRRRGIPVLNSLPRLRAIRIRVPSTDVLDDIRRNGELSFEYGTNLYVYTPDDPHSTDLETSASEFGDDAARWLGLTGDNSSWGKGVIVAILDTGVAEHPVLNADNIRKIDLVGEGTPEGDYAGHATAVCSILAGNGDGVTGIAPATSILSIQVLDSYGIGDAFTLAQGILRAVDEGADVISLSLAAEGDSPVVRDAVAYAVQAGVAIVAAAGNGGEGHVTYPAQYEGVTAVGAIDARGEREEYTNSGDELDILAPGASVSAAWDEETVAFSGTSASVPYVTATVASLLGMDPEMTPIAAVQEMLDNANDNGAPGNDLEYGNGVLDIGRLQRRDTENVIDAALSSHFLPVEILQGDHLPVVVSAQNRGTASLASLSIATNLAGESLNTEFTDIAPGETVSVTLTVDAELIRQEGSIKLTSWIILPDGGDINRGNDSRTSTITLTTPSQPVNGGNP